MNKSALLLISLVLLIGFNGCKKEKKNTFSNGSSVLNVNYQKASFSGIIVDEANNAISGAVVNIGNHNTTTNEYGIFIFENVSIPEKNAFVTVIKSGYLKGYRTFNSKFQKNATLEIQLIESSKAGSFNAITGGTITLNNGTEVTFEANSIKYELGNNYYGNVNVSFVHLDPTDERLFQKMPGDLVGERENGDEARLISYGMINVVLTDDSGKKLQIANGKKAKIKLFIPNSIQANASNTIPLWHFDENFGVWKEEGQATKEGNFYVGVVSHFSWWKSGDPNQVAAIEGKIFCDGTPLQYIDVWGYSDGVYSGWSFTNNDGYFYGFAPSNVNFKLIADGLGQELEIYSGILADGEILDLGIIEFCPAQISGTLIDCLGNPISGYVYLSNSTSIIKGYTSTGVFSFPCQSNANYTLLAINNNTNLTSTPINVTSGSFGTITDIGNVSVCSQETYFNFYIDGGTFSNQFIDFNIDIDRTHLYFYNSSSGNIGANDINGQDYSYGNTNITSYSGYLNLQLSSYISYPDSITNQNNILFNIDNLSNVGGISTGSFSGTCTNGNGSVTYTISNGKFGLIREQ
jgi:hypothetical protein